MGKLSIARSFGTASEAQQIRTPELGVDQWETTPCSAVSRGKAQLGAQSTNQQTPNEDILDTPFESRPRQNGFPIQPRRIADQELAFVPAEEVAKRDGKEGAKLCSLVVLEDDHILNQA